MKLVHRVPHSLFNKRMPVSRRGARTWAAFTRVSSDCSAADEEIDDQNDNCDNQKQVNKSACHVKAPSQKPQNHQDGEDCP